MRRVSSRRGNTRPVCNASTVARQAVSRIARSACSYAMPVAAVARLLTASCMCPRRGPTTVCAARQLASPGRWSLPRSRNSRAACSSGRWTQVCRVAGSRVTKSAATVTCGYGSSRVASLSCWPSQRTNPCGGMVRITYGQTRKLARGRHELGSFERSKIHYGREFLYEFARAVDLGGRAYLQYGRAQVNYEDTPVSSAASPRANAARPCLRRCRAPCGSLRRHPELDNRYLS